MLVGYNFHLQGKRHKEKGDVCQDYSMIYEVSPAWKIIAVADGVSAAAHAEIASKLGCETACDFIKAAFPFDNFSAKFLEEDIEAVIKSAMHAAANAIEEYADSQEDEYDKYDTTLVIALYNGESVYMGMIGDSGVVLLLDDGELKFSSPMNDAEGHVFPLRFRFRYVTGGMNNVAAVFCTTDGLFKDYFVQFGKPDKSRADRLIPYELLQEDSVENIEEYLDKFKEDIISFCETNPSLTDDISVSLLLNTDKRVVKTKKDTVDFISQIRAIISIYTDSQVQQKAFRAQILAYYPDFSDDEIDRLYSGEIGLNEVLEMRKKNVKEQEEHLTDEKTEIEKTESEEETESIELRKKEKERSPKLEVMSFEKRHSKDFCKDIKKKEKKRIVIVKKIIKDLLEKIKNN